MLALRVDLVKGGGSCQDYSHVEARVVEVENGKIEDFWHAYDSRDNAYFQKLGISCQMGGGSGRDPYAFNIRYQDIWQVDRATSRKMYKTLERIHKGLEKFYTEIGDFAGYADYLMRISSILGIKHWVFYGDDLTGNAGLAKDRIERLIADGQEYVAGSKAA